MAYDEGLAQRIRSLLEARSEVRERKMFGGLAFMVDGHMCCGVVGQRLMARVGPHQYEELLKQEHAHEMDFTGRPMRGMLYVDEVGLTDDREIRQWVSSCLTFVAGLPPK